MAKTNPLLADLNENEAFPSVSVALPTGGRWYDESVLEGADPLDLDVGILGIMAEQNYRDPWLLMSGESMPRMLKDVCPSVKQPSELAEVDLEAILLASRLVSFGPTMELKHKCEWEDPEAAAKADEDREKAKLEEVAKEAGVTEDELPDAVKAMAKDIAEEEEKLEGRETQCGHENTVELDIGKHIMRYEVIDDAVVAERFVHKLSRVNQTVHFRPMPYKNVIKQIKDVFARDRELQSMNTLPVESLVMDDDVVKKYADIMESASGTAVRTLLAHIHAVETSSGELVNGDDFIMEWLLSMPADEVDAMMEFVKGLNNWLQDFGSVKYECSECGHEQSFRLELDAERLFGSAGASPAPKKPSQRSKRGAGRRKIR